MLQQINRLKKVRDFNMLMKHGHWTNGQFLDLKVLDLSKIPVNKLPKRVSEEWFRNQLKIAFTVGLKIDKRAIVRNRLKRQMREVARLYIKDKKFKKGNYGLFVAKTGAKDRNYEEIKKEITVLSTKAGLLC